METNQDEWIVNPAMPRQDAIVNMMNKKVNHTRDALLAAAFWHELQLVNPHYAELCTQQVKVQWGWAQANAAECAEFQKTLKAEGKDREDLVDTARWYADECTTLLAECEAYDPTTAPAWAQKRITAIDSRLVDSGRANGWLVGNCPAVGFYIMLYGGSAPQWTVGDPPINLTDEVTEPAPMKELDFTDLNEHEATLAEPSDLPLQPLDITEDRTTEQKLEDGDQLAPTHCKSCGAPLTFHNNSRLNQFLSCKECSDPARYYVVSYGGKLFLKPKKGKKQ